MTDPQPQAPPPYPPAGPGAPQYAPYAPPPRRGVPGWAITLIVAGGLLLVGVLIAGFLTLGAIGRSLSTAASAPHPVEELLPPGADAPDLNADEALRQAEADAEFVIGTHEQYLADTKDGSILTVVPGGTRVDPDYIAAFLYTLSDLRSAVRFAPPSAANAEQLREYAEKVAEVERRFLAGEDLDIDIEITREDGSVFTSDGKYRLQDK